MGCRAGPGGAPRGRLGFSVSRSWTRSWTHWPGISVRVGVGGGSTLELVLGGLSALDDLPEWRIDRHIAMAGLSQAVKIAEHAGGIVRQCGEVDSHAVGYCDGQGVPHGPGQGGDGD